MSDLLVFWEWIAPLLFCSSKLRDSPYKSNCFHHVFDSFSMFFLILCLRANSSRHYLLCWPLLKIDMSKSLSLLFTKEQFDLGKVYIAISLFRLQKTGLGSLFLLLALLLKIAHSLYSKYSIYYVYTYTVHMCPKTIQKRRTHEYDR